MFLQHLRNDKRVLGVLAGDDRQVADLESHVRIEVLEREAVILRDLVCLGRHLVSFSVVDFGRLLEVPAGLFGEAAQAGTRQQSSVGSYRKSSALML